MFFECAPRCFAHNQRKNIFNFVVQKRLRAFLYHIFTKGVRDELPQSKPDGFDSSLGEGASGETGSFALEPGSVPPCQGPHPRGGCRRRRLGEFCRRQFPQSKSDDYASALFRRDVTVGDGEGEDAALVQQNAFPRTAKGSPLRESRKSRQGLTERGVQEKLSAVVTSVISVQ